MVSFQNALPETPTTQNISADFEASSHKRKREDPFPEELFKDQTSSDKNKSLFHVDTPFSSDKWRQYLTIQSGQIKLCNTRVKETSSREERKEAHMSLDLELNLTSDSVRKREEMRGGNFRDDVFNIEPSSSNCKKDSSNSPSWLSISEGEYKEMVATVCMRCHMLVMLCKSSPSCPNCKFLHPPDQSPSKFLKRRCTLFC